MSRIGKLPITLPKGVEVKIDGNKVHVKGPKGELEDTFSQLIGIKLEDGTITVTRPNDEPKVRALHGPGLRSSGIRAAGRAAGRQAVDSAPRQPASLRQHGPRAERGPHARPEVQGRADSRPAPAIRPGLSS